MLRRILFFLLLIGCAASTLSAQTLTTVTGTITDANGIPYSNATVNIQLAPVPPGRATCQGQPINVQGSFQTDANGSFTTTLCANANILPASSQWQFNVSISPGVLPPLGFGPQSFSVLVTISTSSPQDVSSALSTAAPALARVNGTPGSGCVPAGGASGNVLTDSGSGTCVSAGNGVTGTNNFVRATSPALAGVPTAPTAAPGTNTTQLATTAFVGAAAGSGFTPQVNSVALPSAGLNLINSSTNTCGLTSTFTNTTSVTVQNEIAGTLLNGCLPFAQVNSGNLASRGMSNFINSTVNAIGLTDSVSNPATNQVKHEAGGLLNATGGGCGVSNPTIHLIAVAEGSSPCNYFGSNRTGDTVSFNNGADPSASSPGIIARSVAGPTDAIACRTASGQGDNLAIVEYINTGTTTVTVPDAGSTGCDAGFTTRVIAGINGQTVTFNRTTSSTFKTITGSSATAGLTTFNLTGGQYANFTISPGGNWDVTIVPGTPIQYTKWLACDGKGLGDGLNAIPAGTYLQSTCKNISGVTVTITGVQCFTDNAGTSSLNAAGNTLGALLTGVITCSTTYVAGTQSANVALTANDFIKFTFVADGTSKQTDWLVSGTY